MVRQIATELQAASGERTAVETTAVAATGAAGVAEAAGAAAGGQNGHPGRPEGARRRQPSGRHQRV